MATKENEGGVLTNEQIEADLKAKGGAEETPTGLRGVQDTGDKGVRHLGTGVQKRDGTPPEHTSAD